MSKQYITVSKYRGAIYSKEIDQQTKLRSFLSIHKYPFRFFSPVKNKEEVTGWTDVNGNPLKEMTADSIKDFTAKTKVVQEYGYGLFGSDKLDYQYIYEEFKDRPLNHLISVGFFDIETAKDPILGYSPAHKADNEILSISFIQKNKTMMWATKDLPSRFCEENNLEFYWFNTETEMINNFIRYIGDGDVDVLTGWNIETYDIPYTINRARNLGLNESLISPFGKINERMVKDKFGNEQQTYNIVGIEVLDYLLLYKKFTRVTRDNYTLNHIAYCELNEEKVDYSEVHDLQALYETNFIKFAEYNIHDSYLVKRLDDKLKLIDLCITIAYKAGVNFQDALGTVKMWTFYAYREMLDKYMVPPMISLHPDEDSIVGGFVQEPQLGMHEWTVSFDLASLYPHNQMGCNISPDKLMEDKDLPAELLKLRSDIWKQCTLVDDVIDKLANKEINLSLLKKYNLCMTPNVQFYKRDSLGFIPRVLKQIYNERSEAKKKMLLLKQEKETTKNSELDNEIAMLDAIQSALKIMMNSEYGAMGNSGFIFFDTRNAEAITSVGQTAIKFIARKFNEYFETLLGVREDICIASDTDSVYLRFGPLVRKFFSTKSDKAITDIIDKICKEKIQPFITESYTELADYLNCYQMEWKMKREAIASKSVFVAKKRYFMHVLDNEGVRMKEPKLKVTGLDAVRSSTPEICRDALKKTMKIILEKNEEELQAFVLEFEKKFNEAHLLDISSPRSVSDIEKYLDSQGNMLKGIPIAVRGACIFNKAIQRIDPTYPTIKSGDKTKFVYCKLPNKFKSNVIALPNNLPASLCLEEHEVDRRTQFEKTFMKPLTMILDVIKWRPEKINDLASFFS